MAGPGLADFLLGTLLISEMPAALVLLYGVLRRMFAAAALSAEIDEPLLRILQLGAQLGDLAEERLNRARDRVRLPPAIRGGAALQILEEWTHLGELALGLDARELRHMLTTEYRPGRG